MGGLFCYASDLLEMRHEIFNNGQIQWFKCMFYEIN